MSVREELAGYVALQHLLSRKSALKREMETPPEEVVSQRSSYEARVHTASEKRERATRLSTEHETLQREAEALREEREHFRKQKSMVTNMKQLTAVVSELDHVETQLKAKEDRLLEIMQELEAIERDLAILEQETPDEKQAREKAEAAWEERRKVVARELTAVERSLRETQVALGEKAVDRFKKLWTSRRPHAVVPLEGSSCSACHADLRPSLVQQVRAVESLTYCDSCRRLLFDPEQFAADVA